MAPTTRSKSKTTAKVAVVVVPKQSSTSRLHSASAKAKRKESMRKRQEIIDLMRTHNEGAKADGPKKKRTHWILPDYSGAYRVQGTSPNRYVHVRIPEHFRKHHLKGYGFGLWG